MPVRMYIGWNKDALKQINVEWDDKAQDWTTLIEQLSAYYAKLAQKFIHVLSLNTAQGVLYPIDMRLRPSGNAGPVAVSLSSFVQYYHENHP